MNHAFRKILLVSFIGVLCAFGFAAHSVSAQSDDSAAPNERIDSFDSAITVNPDATIDVSEKIVYDFGSEERHGIYRDIPLVQVAGAVGDASISGVTVTDENGTPYNINSLSYDSDGVSVQVGDPDQTITGIHTYVIQYHVRHAIGYFSGYDEIYWNATGNEWTVPIEKASATVTLPAAIPQGKLSYDAYCGESGQNGTCGDISVATNANTTTVSFADDSYLKNSGEFPAGSGMTVSVGFPTDTVSADSLQWWEKDQTYYDIAFGIFGFFLLIFLAWFFSTYIPEHRRRKQPIIAEYEPPAGITPSMAGYIYKKLGIPTGVMATSDILYLAAEGYITIEGSDSDSGTDSHAGGRVFRMLGFVVLLAIFGLIFGWWFLLIILVVAAFHGKKTVQDIKAFFNPVHFKITRTDKQFSGPSHLDKLYSLVSAPGMTVDLDSLKKESHYNAFDDYQSKVKDACSAAEADGVEPPKKKSRKVLMFRTIFIVVAVAIAISAIAGVVQALGSIGGQVPITISIDFFALIASAVIFGVIKSSLRSSLDHMTPTWYKVAGLREYIKVAEKDRINFESDPDKSMRIFSDLLPYATAFGLEEKWAKVFSGIVTTPPNWYRGSNARAFSAGYMVASMHSFNSSLTTVSNSGRPAPSSSGGSFGGGFSGGGGGGGGGGSW